MTQPDMAIQRAAKAKLARPTSFRRRPVKAAPVAVAPGVSPAVRALLEEIDRRRISYRQIEKQAGPCSDVLHRWAKGASPTLANLEAVASVLGLRVTLALKDG